MTVGELKGLIKDFPDETEIILNGFDTGLDETIFFAPDFGWRTVGDNPMLVIGFDSGYSKFYQGE